MCTAVVQELLDTEAAGAYLDTKVQTLAVWRCGNRGPKFVRIGRNIRYRRADLDAYLEQHTVTPSAT